MFSSLKVRDFRIYWLSMLVSLIGTWTQTVAQSWLVFQLTNSAALLGLVGFLGAVPIFIFSLFGGVLADRVNKGRILIFTQSIFMLLAFSLAVLIQKQMVTFTQVVFIIIINGLIMAFDAPARQAVVVELAGRENLFNAIALSSVAFNFSRVIGPVLAGIMISVTGMSGCFYINGISFLAPISVLFLVKTNGKAAGPKIGQAVWTDLKEGLVFIKNNRSVLVLMTMVSVVSLFGISYIVLMPVFVKDVLRANARSLGVLMSASGLGALMSALILARLTQLRHKGRLLILSALFFSFSLILFSLFKHTLNN